MHYDHYRTVPATDPTDLDDKTLDDLFVTCNRLLDAVENEEDLSELDVLTLSSTLEIITRLGDGLRATHVRSKDAILRRLNTLNESIESEVHHNDISDDTRSSQALNTTIKSEASHHHTKASTKSSSWFCTFKCFSCGGQQATNPPKHVESQKLKIITNQPTTAATEPGRDAKLSDDDEIFGLSFEDTLKVEMSGLIKSNTTTTPL